MPWVEGWVHTPLGFVQSTVRWDGHLVEEVGGRGDGPPVARGMILPGFFNGHTHLGDAVVQQELQGTLEELVAPPHGLKQQALAKARPHEVVEAMGASLGQMAASGATAFADFREGGVEGVELMAKALGEATPRGFTLGRPRGLHYDAAEVDDLLGACVGLGLSASRDWPPDEIVKVASHVHRRGKLFALHASEGVREELDPILDLKPDLLVHMTMATDDDLTRCRQAGVPIAICPRSQAFFGKVVDIPRMVRAGVKLLLGTDNAMLGPPSMLRELEFAHRMARLKGGLLAKALVSMAWEGKRLFTASHATGLTPGQAADFMVLRGLPQKPGEHHVLRATEADMSLVVAQGTVIYPPGMGV